MTDYNFVRFTNRGSKLGNYRISVNVKSHTLGLLSGFYSKEEIKDYKKAVLFFDKSKKVIGISFTNDADAEGAFTISHNNEGNTGSIAAHSFFIGNEITEGRYTGHKTPSKIKDNKLGTLFVIDLLQS